MVLADLEKMRLTAIFELAIDNLNACTCCTVFNQLLEGHKENNVVCQVDRPEIKCVQVIHVSADLHERYCKMALRSFIPKRVSHFGGCDLEYYWYGTYTNKCTGPVSYMNCCCVRHDITRIIMKYSTKVQYAQARLLGTRSEPILKYWGLKSQHSHTHDFALQTFSQTQHRRDVHNNQPPTHTQSLASLCGTTSDIIQIRKYHTTVHLEA